MSVFSCYCPLPQLHVLNYELDLGKNRNKILSGGVVGLSVSQNWLKEFMKKVHWVRPANLSILQHHYMTWHEMTIFSVINVQKQAILQSLTKLSGKAQFCPQKTPLWTFAGAVLRKMTQQFLFRPIPVFCICFFSIETLNFNNLKLEVMLTAFFIYSIEFCQCFDFAELK